MALLVNCLKQSPLAQCSNAIAVNSCMVNSDRIELLTAVLNKVLTVHCFAVCVPLQSIHITIKCVTD